MSYDEPPGLPPFLPAAGPAHCGRTAPPSTLLSSSHIPAWEPSMTSGSRPLSSSYLQSHRDLGPRGLPTCQSSVLHGQFLPWSLHTCLHSYLWTFAPALPFTTETLITSFCFVIAYSGGDFVRACLIHDAVVSDCLALIAPSRAPPMQALVANLTWWFSGLFRWWSPWMSGVLWGHGGLSFCLIPEYKLGTILLAEGYIVCDHY